MGAFIPVAGIESEADQGSTDIVAGLERRGGIASVMKEDITAEFEFMLGAEIDEMLAQVKVKGATGVFHGNGGSEFTGILVRSDGAVVDGDHLRYVATENMRCADAYFLRDGKEQITVERRCYGVIQKGLGSRQNGGDTGLIIKKTAVYKPVGVHLRRGVDGDKITDAET